MEHQVTVDREKLASLESDMKHTQSAVHEMKTDLREVRDSGKKVEIAIIELAEIARTNQRIFPRLEKLEEKVDKNNTLLAKYAGAIAVIAVVGTYALRNVAEKLIG